MALTSAQINAKLKTFPASVSSKYAVNVAKIGPAAFAQGKSQSWVINEAFKLATLGVTANPTLPPQQSMTSSWPASAQQVISTGQQAYGYGQQAYGYAASAGLVPGQTVSTGPAPGSPGTTPTYTPDPKTPIISERKSFLKVYWPYLIAGGGLVAVAAIASKLR